MYIITALEGGMDLDLDLDLDSQYSQYSRYSRYLVQDLFKVK